MKALIVGVLVGLAATVAISGALFVVAAAIVIYGAS